MFWTAFTIGLFGSLHCVGMCGPILMALPYEQNHKGLALWKILLYNFGRISTYMMLGLLIGLLGKGLFIAGMQKWLSLAIGITLIFMAFGFFSIENLGKNSGVLTWLKKQIAQLIGQKRSLSFYSIGLMNGLLPCGLVYLAVLGAVADGTVLGGALYMGLFGLGTIPLMLMTALLSKKLIHLSIRYQLRRLYPIFLVLLGVLFLSRGFNFDIPANFGMWETMQETPVCH